MRGHRPLSAVPVARHFHKHGTDAGSEHGFEHQVHDLRALGLRVVLEQHGGGTTTIHSSNAIETLTLLEISNADDLCGICGTDSQCQQQCEKR